MYRRSSTLLSLSTIEYGYWLFCATHADSTGRQAERIRLLGDGLGCEQVFNPHRQCAYTYSGGVVDRCGDRRGNASQADFSDTASTILPQDGIGNVQEVDVDFLRISDRGNDVIGEIVVDG